jgi:GTPase SAR1 family protein
MTDVEHIEYRFIIIGDQKVGKKSIINRFKTMNATRTHDIEDAEGSFEANKNIKDETMKRKIMTFFKTLTISQFYMELKFFYVPAADEKSNDKKNEYNEELENNKGHLLNFDKVKKIVEKIMTKGSKAVECNHIFMFVFDLNNFASFEIVKLYHEELSKYIQAYNSNFSVLIGNKCDVRTPFEIHEKEMLESFIETNNVNYYEISSKLFFKFETFFEKLFFDTFEKSNEQFSTKYFKERFHNIMTLKQT